MNHPSIAHLAVGLLLACPSLGAPSSAGETNGPTTTPTSQASTDDSTPSYGTSNSGIAVSQQGLSNRMQTHPEVRALCKELSQRLTSVSLELCTRVGLKPSGGRSVEGRSILARTLPPANHGNSFFRETSGLRPLEKPGRVLLIGGTHGDELSTVSIAFRWLDRLLTNPDHRLYWRIAPLVNPDGLLAQPPRRTNSNGVDLNRNMPSDNWEDEAHLWWARETDRNPRRYPGPLALSEPESEWLYQEIATFRPDIIVSLHAPYNNVDFDGPPEGPQQLGSLRLKYLGTFPGSLGRFGAEHSLPIVTIELASANRMPKPKEQAAIWRDLLNYLAHKSTEERPNARPLGALNDSSPLLVPIPEHASHLNQQ